LPERVLFPSVPAYLLAGAAKRAQVGKVDGKAR
jgi:hypothetical protein